MSNRWLNLNIPRSLLRAPSNGESKGGEHPLWSRAGSIPRTRNALFIQVAWAFAGVLLAGCAASSAPNYAEILTNTNRPEAERNIDAVRKPNEVMAFYGVKRGQKVADIFAARGYYTAILSQMVGSEGVVYSANAAPRQELHDRLKQPGMGNVRVLDGPFDKLALPQDGSLDFVLLHLDYHEIAADVRRAMNARIFAALKSGGSYGVVDHSAKAGRRRQRGENIAPHGQAVGHQGSDRCRLSTGRRRENAQPRRRHARL